MLWRGAAAAQQVIHIPKDQPTIQAGIDAAAAGDTVIVSPGTYTEALDFKGKAITVTSGAVSASDPAVAATILRQTGNSLGFNPIAVFHNGEDTRSTLNGFTIQTQGPVYSGIDVEGSVSLVSATAVDANSIQNVFSSAVHTTYTAGAPTISNNGFSGTAQAIGLVGGVIEGNIFSGMNATSVVFAGVQANSAPTEANDIHGNVFTGNTTTNHVLVSANALIYNNVFQRNVVSPYTSASSKQRNSTSLISIAQPAVFAGNLITQNQADDVVAYGGGGGMALLINNTLAANIASVDCGASCVVHQVVIEKHSAYAGNDYILANNIFQTATPEQMIACQDDIHGPYTPALQDTLGVDHNLFSFPPGGGVLDASCRVQVVNAGNLYEAPEFADAAHGDYRPGANSPAVDAGNNSVFAVLQSDALTAMQFSLTTDLDGMPRPVDATGKGYPVVDMGAFERAGVVDGRPTALLLTPSSYLPEIASKLTLTAQLGSALGVPPGVITLAEDGVPVSSAVADSHGAATFPMTVSSVGVHEFVASYPGMASFPPATSVKLELDGRLIPTYLTLAVPPLARLGVPVVVRVTSKADDGSIPAPVSLSVDGVVQSTVPLDGSGQGAVTLTSLSAGKHTISAQYAASGNYAASSVVTTLVVTQSDFSLGLSPAMLQLSTGAPGGATTVLLTSLGSFAGPVQLSLGTVPAVGTFALSTSAVSLAVGGTASAAVAVSIVGAGGQVSALHRRSAVGPLAALMSCALPLFLLGRRRASLLAMLVFASVCCAGLVGCTTVRTPLATLAPGTYVIPVTATSQDSGLTHTANLTVVVSP